MKEMMCLYYKHISGHHIDEEVPSLCVGTCNQRLGDISGSIEAFLLRLH